MSAAQSSVLNTAVPRRWWIIVVKIIINTCTRPRACTPIQISCRRVIYMRYFPIGFLGASNVSSARRIRVHITRPRFSGKPRARARQSIERDGLVRVPAKKRGLGFSERVKIHALVFFFKQRKLLGDPLKFVFSCVRKRRIRLQRTPVDDGALLVLGPKKT